MAEKRINSSPTLESAKPTGIRPETLKESSLDRIAYEFLLERRQRGRRLVLFEGDFYEFNGATYRKVRDSENIKNDLISAVRRVWRDTPPLDKHGNPKEPRSSDFSTAWAILRSEAAITHVSEPGQWIDPQKKPADWNPDPFSVVVCKNGLLDMDTGRLIPSSDAVFVTSTGKIEWLGIDEPCPRFDSWLAEVQPTEENQRQLRWLMGYVLHGDNPVPKLFCLQGRSRSGKGSFIRFLQRLVGEDQHAATDIAGLQDRFGLEVAIGKKLLAYPEYRPENLKGAGGMNRVTQVLLSLTGRDTVSVQRKGRKTISTMLRAKFVMGTNSVLTLPDSANVIMNRVHTICFPNTFEARTVLDLDQQIFNAESSGILAAAVRGWRAFKEAGMTFPKTAESQAMAELVSEGSTQLKGFIGECLTEAEGEHVPIRDAFKALKAYLVHTGETAGEWSERRLKRELVEFNVKLFNPRFGDVQISSIKDMRLTREGLRLLNEAAAAKDGFKAVQNVRSRAAYTREDGGVLRAEFGGRDS